MKSFVLCVVVKKLYGYDVIDVVIRMLQDEIVEYLKEFGKGTVEDIATYFSISDNVIYIQVLRLKRKGIVVRDGISLRNGKSYYMLELVDVDETERKAIKLD